MHLTSVDAKRFSISTAGVVPPEQLWDNRSEAVRKMENPRRSESVRMRSICCTEHVWGRLSGKGFVWEV